MHCQIELRWGGPGWFVASMDQFPPHSGTSKRAQRSSAWLWCFMFGFLSLLVPKSQLNPQKCVCASVAHILSVTLSQRKSTKEVYRRLMRNMRTDAIVNQWSTTRTPTAPLVPFVEAKECFVIRRGYETARPVSSYFCLTVPPVVYFIWQTSICGIQWPTWTIIKTFWNSKLYWLIVRNEHQKVLYFLPWNMDVKCSFSMDTIHCQYRVTSSLIC